MAKRDERNERKARVTGDEEYASSANWINQNKRAGEKLAFSVPEGLPVVKLEKAKIHEELKRARGSSRRKDTDVERIGTGPASHYFDMRKKGIKISDKVLRDEGVLYPTTEV